MIFSSMSSRLLYHLGENLVPVREAGDHVYVFTAVRLQLRRLADLYSWDNRFAEVLDSYGPGTAHFMGEAIEAYLETL
jgi:hypothetical protein